MNLTDVLSMKSWLLVTLAWFGAHLLVVAEDDLPSELKLLNTKYEREIERVTTPVTEGYIRALQALKKRFTQEGKLDEAVAVNARLEEMLGEKMRNPLSFPETLFGLRFLWDKEGQWIEFHPDGKALSWAGPKEWTRTGEMEITLDRGSKVISGPNGFTASNRNGVKIRFEMIRNP